MLKTLKFQKNFTEEDFNRKLEYDLMYNTIVIYFNRNGEIKSTNVILNE